MKSTVTFKEYFYESITAGAALGGSSGGFSPESISGSDFYAPGDARLAANYGTYSRKGKVGRKKRRKNRRRSRK